MDQKVIAQMIIGRDENGSVYGLITSGKIPAISLRFQGFVKVLLWLFMVSFWLVYLWRLWSSLFFLETINTVGSSFLEI